jgi:serine/threonine protein phosphatase 1
MTRYAIGDIHGGTQTFRALLDKINLHREDRLYLLGDYVDRGADSKGVLDTILDLISAGHDVRALLGNHDDMMLQSMNDGSSLNSLTWYEGWGWHTLNSFDEMFMCDVPAIYRVFLESLPTIYVEDDFVLVHAGLDMSMDDPINQTGDHERIWDEAASVDADKVGGRSLIVGHRIHTLEDIRASLTTSYIRLDNGAFSGMLPLVALNMDNRELITQEWLDGPSED